MRNLILDALAPKPKAGLMNPGVTLYGDSIAHSIAWRLRDLPNNSFHQLTQPGDTAANAWRRFPYDTRHTCIVVLQHGTNDLTGGRDPVPYLRKMAEYAIAEGRDVVFTGLSKRADRDVSEVNREIAELAQDMGCPFAWWQTIPLSSIDGLHPDSEMANDLAGLLAATLRGME